MKKHPFTFRPSPKMLNVIRLIGFMLFMGSVIAVARYDFTIAFISQIGVIAFVSAQIIKGEILMKEAQDIITKNIELIKELTKKE